MEGAREQSCLYHVSAELNTSSKVADSSFTTDWLLSNLHLFDPQFSKINELGTVTKITAVDISDGKGFISKVYKVDLNFEHTNDPYEVILKVPGVDSFNNAYQDEKDRKQNVNVMTERFFSTLHNRECDFYLNFASHLDIPLAKIYKVQKWVLGKQPGALMMESMLGKGDSYPLPDGANIQQIFEVVKHICSFQKYGLSLPTEQWSGKYSYKVFDYFARNNINAPFFEKLKMLKPGVFDEGIKVLEKYRLNKKFMNYVMIDIHKDLGLPAVLCHGDFWNNNILWKRDSSAFLSNEIAAIIDWQGFHEGCLTTDLSRFLCICTDGDVRREYEDQVLQYYYDTMAQHLKENGKHAVFSIDAVRKAYMANFIQQATVCMIAGPFLYNCDNLTGDEKEIKQAELEKLLLRGQMSMEDALVYLKELAEEILALGDDEDRVSLMDENLVEEADKKSIKDEPLSSDEEDEYAIQVDEADGEEDLEKTELLPYENNLMVDTMDDDVLFIAARGLGLERLFQLHLQLYSSQKLLVLVLNTNQNDEYFFLKKLKECGVDSPPKVLNSELSVQLRESLYHAGGVQFVTSRILMTDLLTGRIPVENVSGVVVYRAHTVMTSFQESFIIRLLREKKPNIFVKAFTDSASAIAARGIGQLQRLVDKLYVRRVRLLPRFDVEVKSCFEKDAPRLIEIMVDVPMSYRKAITPLVDIIRTCVKELKQCSPRIAASVAEESASPWSGITPSALEIELKKNTITLTEKQQRLLKELDELRAILGQIQDLDPITAYRSFKSIRSGKDVINANSGWVFTRTAGKIYAALEDIVKARDSKGEPAILHPAKWAALRSSLEEIRETAVRRFTEGNTTPINILILASSNTVCSQMAELLRFGIPSLVSNLHKELANEEGKDCEVLDASPIWEPHRIALFGMDTKQYKKDREGMMTELIQEQKKVARDGRKRRAKAQGVKGKSGGAQTLISEFGIVHYKKMRGWNTTEERVAGSKDGEVTEVEANTEAGGSSQPCDEPPFEDPQIVILPHGERYKLINHLESLKPEFVVFYNTDLVSLRIVEMFKAVEQCPMNVYSLMYRESTEEDRYLCAIQREQLAFEQLLREQMVLLIPREYNVEREQPPVIQKSTRDGRATQPAETPKIIVDMREFNSELPTVLYQKGIDVVPSTIEVGDYILSDEIAVERKALDDLTQSLHSGRIFKQIQEMTLHYKHTVLLIESREKFRMKMVNGGPFQGELSRRCRDTRSLFCILLRSTPSIQCVWSLDPQNTAELFEELKMNQANPSVEKALAIKCNDGANEQGSSASTDKSSKASENKQKTGKPKNINKVLQRQLTNIPGLAAGDVERIMKSETIGNLYELANASESTLMEANGQNAVQAQKLVNFFSVDFRNM